MKRENALMEKRDSDEGDWGLLRDEIRSCRLCRERFGFEPNPIVWGSADSKIMQISQAPSKSVHETGIPFHDQSGQKLRREWYKITDEEFYDVHNFYIVSVGHCYPGKNASGGDRMPPALCAKTWLDREVGLVNNEIYLLVGGAAAKFFFPNRGFTGLVFENLTLRGKPAYVLPHPSPLNIKWFRDNPDFLKYRIREIRLVIHQVLNLPR
ncbi:uracil-DNA glycosylase family protein [Diplocloster agilis]|uniref:uracil-DNA glycosylase family protein n=1 Tax=Diplocloster agilis TaxID=2850323 RepID=UPI001EE8A616|nr:uracil-DNA glycosylase family protein [Diplocloster agilis]